MKCVVRTAGDLSQNRRFSFEVPRKLKFISEKPEKSNGEPFKVLGHLLH